MDDLGTGVVQSAADDIGQAPLPDDQDAPARSVVVCRSLSHATREYPARVGRCRPYAYRTALTGRLRRALDAILTTLRPTARLAPLPGVGIEIAPIPAVRAAQQRLLELLDLPAKLHERSELRTLVVFDEFQEVLTAGTTIDRLIRSRIQHHGPAAAYIFAGSHPGLMAELFHNRERALFGQARPVELAPLPEAELIAYVGSRFEATGRDPGPTLPPLANLAQGHPQRAMLLAHHLWEATPVGEQSVFARATLERFQLTKGGAQQARTALLNGGALAGQGSRLTIIDPLFAAWIAADRRSP